MLAALIGPGLAASACVQLSTEPFYAGVHLAPERFEARYICEPPRSFPIYRSFFGLATVERASEEELFPDRDRYVYRFRERKTAGDWWFSVLLGMSLSLTRGTLDVQRCVTPEQAVKAGQDDPFALSEADRRRLEAGERSKAASEEARRRALERAAEARREAGQ